jgi:protease-4
VDELGGLDKAMDAAVKAADVEGYTVVTYPKPAGLFDSLLGGTKQDYLDGKLKASLGSYYDCLRAIDRLQTADRVQARLPFEIILK